MHHGIEMFQVAQNLPRESSDEMLATVTDALARSSSHIAFPAEIERCYQQEVRNQYRRRTLVTAIFALVIFYGIVVLGLADDAMNPLARSAGSALAGFLPAVAAMVWLYVRPLSMRRQHIMAAAVLAFTLSANLMVHGASLEGTRMVTYAFGLIVITANVVLSLDFRTAVVTSTVCCLMTGGFVFADIELDWHHQLLPVLLMAATALLTLAANYRIETTSRYVYLLLLREKLQSRSIQAQNERLSRISNSDPLTGIANRRAFDEALQEGWRKAVDEKVPVALLMLDIDHFKRFNDAYGHPAGDTCLTQIAHAINEATRAHGDMAARLGGEEFAVLLYNADYRTARAIARRIHDGVAALGIPHSASPTNPFVSVSIGMADAMPVDGGTAEGLVLAADKALYAAKAGGRNQTGSDPRKAA